MRICFLLFFSLLSGVMFSQEISGTVTDEEGNALGDVLVFNMNTGQKTYTLQNGTFTLTASVGDEVRYVRKGFDRRSQKLQKDLFTTIHRIILIRSTAEIEEVKVKPKLTGNLTEDSKHGGDDLPTQKLKIETGKYIMAKSSPEILAPKPGEFVQPVGPGFSVGAIASKWDHLDFMNFLIDTLGLDFFTQDLHLQPTEIKHFIFYIFQNFEQKEILKYGAASGADIARFVAECNRKLADYRNNVPNNPPKKKRNRK